MKNILKNKNLPELTKEITVRKASDFVKLSAADAAQIRRERRIMRWELYVERCVEASANMGSRMACVGVPRSVREDLTAIFLARKFTVGETWGVNKSFPCELVLSW